MTRLRTTALALAAVLTLSACSGTTEVADPEATLSVAGPVVTASDASPDTTANDAVNVPVFDGSHVAVEDWADAASGEGVIILDVRTPEEYSDGHIAGAININLYSGVFEDEVALLDPQGSYAVYCRSGNRSREAIDIMGTLGITTTVGLDGGISAWTAAGHSIATE